MVSATHKQKQKDRINKRKKESAIARKGAGAVSDEVYAAAAAAKAAEQAKKRAIVLEDQDHLIQPHDTLPSVIQRHYPDLWKILNDHRPQHPEKELGYEACRVVWYNDWDQKHSFSFEYRWPIASTGMVLQAVESGNGNKVRSLQVLYALACMEHRERPTVYMFREKFLKEWWKDPSGIYIPSRTVCDRFRKCTLELASALQQIENPDLPDAMTEAPPGPDEDVTMGGTEEMAVGEGRAEEQMSQAEAAGLAYMRFRKTEEGSQGRDENIPQLTMYKWTEQLEDEGDDYISLLDETDKREKMNDWAAEVMDSIEERVREMCETGSEDKWLMGRLQARLSGLESDRKLQEYAEKRGLY